MRKRSFLPLALARTATSTPAGGVSDALDAGRLQDVRHQSVVEGVFLDDRAT